MYNGTTNTVKIFMLVTGSWCGDLKMNEFCENYISAVFYKWEFLAYLYQLLQ